MCCTLFFVLANVPTFKGQMRSSARTLVKSIFRLECYNRIAIISMYGAALGALPFVNYEDHWLAVGVCVTYFGLYIVVAFLYGWLQGKFLNLVLVSADPHNPRRCESGLRIFQLHALPD